MFSIAAAAVDHPDFILNRRGGRIGAKWPVADGLVELGLAIGPPLGGWSNNLFNWMRAEGALPDRFADWDWLTVPQRIEAGELAERDVEAARAAIAAFLAPRTKRELGETAMAHKVLLAPVNDIGDLLASPQLQARGLFAEVSEGGARRTLPWAFAAGPAGMFAEPRGAPLLGEHNSEVYGGLLGITDGDLAGLRRARVI